MDKDKDFTTNAENQPIPELLIKLGKQNQASVKDGFYSGRLLKTSGYNIWLHVATASHSCKDSTGKWMFQILLLESCKLSIKQIRIYHIQNVRKLEAEEYAA